MIKYIKSAEYTCDKCGHVWQSKLETEPGMCAKCKSKLWHGGTVEQVKELTLADRVRDLNTEKRLELFAQFELCCGMNRGQCQCPAEVLPAQRVEATTERKTVAELRELIAPIETGEQIAPVEPVSEDWLFTKDAPQYDDTGRVFRQQYLAPLGKIRRTVEVDEDDIERIIDRNQ